MDAGKQGKKVAERHAEKTGYLHQIILMPHNIKKISK